MNQVLNSSKRTNPLWFGLNVVSLTCLIFFIFQSCQKDNDTLLNQESLNGVNPLSVSAIASNPPVLYWGHETFFRKSGAPVTEIRTIENPDFENFENTFVLKIQNGSDKKTRVSSAEIRIDGILVAGPSDFSTNVSLITKQISGLSSGSVLEVKLNSTPGSFLDLWIEGTLIDFTVTDCDGNVYKTVKIGTQIWMAENLRTTRYCNGDPIPNVTDNAAWVALSTGGYCWWNNDEAIYKPLYGALYNWYAVVDSRKIAPAGWHIPTDADFVTLTTYLGGESVAGGKMKVPGTTYWRTPNLGADNSSGFAGLPGGLRYSDDGRFGYLNINGFWWTCTSDPEAPFPLWAWYRNLDHGNTVCYHDSNPKLSGFSVRCVKDN